MKIVTNVDAAKQLLLGEITHDLKLWAIEVIWQDGRNGSDKTSVIPYDPTGLTESQIDALKKQPSKIHAIKELRQISGWGLKDAKEKCDEIFGGLHPTAITSPRLMMPGFHPVALSATRKHDGSCWRNSTSNCGC